MTTDADRREYTGRGTQTHNRRPVARLYGLETVALVTEEPEVGENNQVR